MKLIDILAIIDIVLMVVIVINFIRVMRYNSSESLGDVSKKIMKKSANKVTIAFILMLGINVAIYYMRYKGVI